MGEQSMKKVLVVLGMHRSGTSAIAKAVECFGADLGSGLLPATEENAKGYWEDADVVAINDKVLSYFGLEWDSLTALTEADLEDDGLAPCFELAVELLTKRFENLDFWAFKDPRTSRLLPFWIRVFETLKIEASYVFAIRNPYDVYKSLEKRDNFSQTKAELLWLMHNLPNLSLTADQRCTYLAYERLLQSPESEMRRVAADLGLYVNEAQLKVYLDTFLDRKLCHSETKNSELHEKLASTLTQQLYSLLTRLACADIKTNDADFNEELSRLSFAYKAMYGFMPTFDAWQKESENHRLRWLEIDLKNNKEKVAQFDSELAHHKALLSGKERQIQQLESFLTDKKQQTEDLERELFAQLEHRKTLEALISELSEAKAHLEHNFNVLYEEVEMIKSGRLYKLQKAFLGSKPAN